MASPSINPLDKLDAEKVNYKNYDEFSFEKIAELKKDLLGNVIARRLMSGPSVLLTGPGAKEVIGTATFLYFYKSLSLEICPYCPQTRNPSLLEPFLKEDLISVFMKGSFTSTPPKFQKLVSEYSECFVGPRSYDMYNYFASHSILKTNKEAERIGNKIRLENHYCAACLDKKLSPKIKKISKFNTNLRNEMFSAIDNIFAIKVPLSEQFANELVNVVEKPNLMNAKKLNNQTSLARYFFASKVLGVHPQMNTSFMNSKDTFVSATRIKIPDELESEHYLNFIKKFRGTLSPNKLPIDRIQTAKYAMRINDEVDKIKSSSKRLFLYKFRHLVPALVLSLTKSGGYNSEAGVNVIKHLENVPGSETITTKLLAAYFRVSPEAIQIWKIRSEAETKAGHRNLYIP